MNVLKIFVIFLGTLLGSTDTTTATAQPIVLKFNVHAANGSVSGTIDLTIDLGKNQFQYDGLYEIQSVTEKSITGILVSHPKNAYGIDVLVLNRDTGEYVVADVGLHCEGKSCANQVGPDVSIFRGYCKRAVL
jgi:hypothetical protein